MFFRKEWILFTLAVAFSLPAKDQAQTFSLRVDQKTLIETFHQSDGLQQDLTTRMRIITGVQARWNLSPLLRLTCSLSNQIQNPISEEGKSMRLSGLSFRELALSYRAEALTGFRISLGRQNVEIGEGLLFSDAAPLTEQYLHGLDAFDCQYILSGKPLQFRALLYAQGREDNLPEMFADQKTPFTLQDTHGGFLSISWVPGRIQGLKKISVAIGTHIAQDHPQAPLEASVTWMDLSWQWPFLSPRTLFRGELAFQSGTVGQKSQQGYALTFTFLRDLSPLFIRSLSFSGTFFSGDDTATSRAEGWFPLFGDTQRFGSWAPYILTPRDQHGMFSNLLVFTARADICFLPKMTHECTFNWAQSVERDALMNAFALNARERGSWLGIRNTFQISDAMWAHFSWEHLFPGPFYQQISSNCNWISAGFFWNL